MSVLDSDVMAHVSDPSAVSDTVPAAGAPTRHPGSFWRLLRSEFALMAGRRRNQVGLVILASVPVIIAFAIWFSTDDGTILGLNLGNGLFVPIGALTVMTGFFLPMAISMVSGDAVAGEASSGTLRYLLTTPVARGRLLAVKYIVLCLGALVAVTVVVLAGTLLGLALFGAGPTTTVSGTQISLWAGFGRVLLVAGYVASGLFALAAVGLFVSTLNEQPMVTTVTVMVFIIVSWILTTIPQLDWLSPWLLVTRWTLTTDFLRDPMMWGPVLGGLGVNAAYAALFGSAAWAYFATKDMTS